MSFSTSTPKTGTFFKGILTTVTAMIMLLFAGNVNSQILFSENFESGTATGWTIINAGSGENWLVSNATDYPTQMSGSTYYLKAKWNSSNAMNTWAITPGVTLNAGQTYSLGFNVGTAGGYVESLKATIGTSATVAAQTTTLLNLPSLTSSSLDFVSTTFTVPATGTYYFGFNGYSIANQFYLAMDNVKIYIPVFADAAPINFSTTSVTQSGMTLNWVDNSTNETSFKVFRSTDNVTFTQVGAAIPSTTTATTGTAYTSAQTGLTAGVTYYYRIVATADADSPFLTGSQATLPPGNVTSITSGLWSAASTWSSGAVPTAFDNVTISDGHTVTIDANGVALSLTVGSGSGSAAILQHDAVATARTLTVSGNMVINSNGTYKSGASASATHTLSVGGNFNINGAGVFNGLASTNNKINITFTGATNNSFTTSATSTTTLNVVTVNKPANGTTKSILDFNPGVLYNTAASRGFTITAGILKISGTATISDKVFSSTSYSIPTAGGFWLNNANFTVTGQAASPTNTGLLRISSGTFNIGSASGNSMSGSTGEYEILGGTVNIAGRITCSGAGKFTQSGGVVNVTTVGNSSSSSGGLDFSSTSSVINISGGVINLVLPSTAGTPIDIRFAASDANISYTGGKIVVGTPTTPAGSIFRLANNLPAIEVTNNTTAAFYNSSSSSYNLLYKDITVNVGCTLDMNGYFNVLLQNLINNGTLKGDKTGSRLYFGGTTAQTYSGTGTVAANFLSLDVDNPAGLTINSTQQFQTARIILFTGGITNANKITLGFGGTSAATVQIGNTTTPTDAGVLDQAPTFNIGSGGQVISYLRTTNPRTIGNEVNPTRILTNLTLDDNVNDITLTGGDLTVSNILTLTNGRIITGSNLLKVTNSAASSIVRTNGYVQGQFARQIPASSGGTVDYLFPIGKSAYNPLELKKVNTLALGTVTIKAEAFDGNAGGTPGSMISAVSTTRYWSVNILDGASNFNNAIIKLNDTRGSFDVIGSSATANGAYSLVGTFPATLTATSIESNALSPVTNISGFYLMANAASPSISDVTITPSGTQCTNVARTITATVTPGGAAVSSVVLKYMVNGGSETSVSMTNTSGNIWTGTIPTVTPSNGTVTWTLTATDASDLVKTYTGTSYKDEPLSAVSITASAAPTTICAGTQVKLYNTLTGNKPNLGEGTSTSTSAATDPFYHGYGGAKTQHIYTAAELMAKGYTAGNITSITLNVGSVGSPLSSFTISIGNTTQSAATSTAISGLTEVYSNASQSFTTGLNTFIFSTPFAWNGTSNIVVSYCFSNNNSGGTSTSVYYDAAGFTSSMALYADNKSAAVICPATTTTEIGSGSNSTTSNRPNTIFGLTNGFSVTSYSWSDGSSVIGTTDTIYVNPAINTSYTSTITFNNGCTKSSPATAITVNPLPAAPTIENASSQCGLGTPGIVMSGAGSGETYRWYLASTGGTAISGQSAASLSDYEINTTTTFYVALYNGTCESLRTAVTATVSTPDAISISAGNPNTCANSTLVLTATSQGTTQNYTYTWSASPEAGSGITGTLTGSSISINPSAAGTYTYTVIGVDGGCTASATLNYTITANPIVVTSSSATGTVCAGTAVDLTALTQVITNVNGTIGAGASTTTSSGGNPFYSYYGGYKTQYIYTAAELTAAGLSAGNITALTFETGTLPTQRTYKGFAVGIASTTNSTFTTAAALPTTNVYNGTGTDNSITLVAGANTITFTTPFYWDGTSNIVVSFCYSNNDSGGSADDTPVKTDTKTDAGFYLYSDSKTAAQICGATVGGDLATAYSYQTSNRLKLTFAGKGITNGVGTNTYVWNPGNISGNAVTVNPTTTTTYTVTVTDPTTTCSTNSDVTVNVRPLPNPVSGAVPSTQCGPRVPTILATGGAPGTYNWYLTPTGGTPITGEHNGELGSYSISETTTFYVAISDGICESTRTPITATVNNPDQVSITTDAITCVNSNLTLTAVQTGTTQNYTYTWTATPEAGSGITGSVTGTSVTINPTAAGTYTYNLTAIDGQCTALASTSVTVNALPVLNVSATETTVCNGTEVTLTATTTTYADVTATIGSGANSTSGIGSPFYSNYGGYKTQFILTASELTAAGLSAGNITALNFEVGTLGTNHTYKEFRIGMAATASSSFESTALPTSTVYTGTLANNAFSPVAGVNTITFATPFYWNGTSNVVISFCYSNNDGGGSADDTSVKTDPTTGKTFVVYDDNETAAAICAATNGTDGISGYTSSPSNRMKISLKGTGATTNAGNLNYSWNPGGYTTNVVNVTPSETTLYTVTGTNPITGCSNSATVNITVNQLPAEPVAIPSEQCGTAIPDAFVISGGNGGNGTFNWYTTEEGGTPVQSSTSATYLDYISETTTFYVSESGENGCESPRVPLTISVIEADLISMTATASTAPCINNEVILEVTQEGGGNTYEYTYSANPSEGSGITGAESGSYVSVFPTSPGTYEYTVNAFDADRGCSAIATATITINPPPGITSVYATPATVCSGGSSTLKVENLTGAPGVATIGAGASTTSGTGSPFYGLWGGYKNQFIFTAAELQAAGIGAGNITAITLNVTAVATGTYKGFAIGIGTTSNSAFATQEALPTTNVYNGPGTDNAYTPTVGDNTFTFSTPFAWDGTSNIVISMCYSNNDSGGGAGDGTVKTDSYSSQVTLSIRDDDQTAAAMCSATTGTDGISGSSTTTSTRPQMKFSAFLGTDNTNFSTYSWSPGGATGSTITVNPTETTTYTVTATGPNGCTNTGTVTVTALALPDAPVASNSTQCGLGTPTASVSGAGTFLWYDAATGGNLVQTGGSTFNGEINTTTTWYVSSTDGTCEGPRSAVTATVNTPDAITAVASSSSICEGGSFNLSVNQTGSNQNYVYTWTVSPETGSGLTNGTTGGTQALTPTAPGTYTYTVTGFDAAGPCTTVSSVEVSVNANPTITTLTATPSEICAGAPTVLKAQSLSVGAGDSQPVGNGTSVGSTTTELSAFVNRRSSFWSQAVFSAAELNAAGLQAGNITAITYNVTSVGDGATNDNYTVRLKTTTNASLSAFETTGFTTVYGPATYTHAVGLNKINFATPFNWDGTSNIIIDVYQEGADALYNAQTYYTTTTGFSRTIYSFDVPVATSGNPSGTTTTSRLNVIFSGSVGTNVSNQNTYTWTPGNLTGASVTVNPTTTTTYTVSAVNNTTGCSSATSQVTVNVLPVSATASASETTICVGGSSTLSVEVTGGAPFTYSWSDGQDVIATSQTKVVNPTVTTTYTVTVKDACGNQTTSSVTVNVNPLPVVSIAEAGPITLCSPATQTLTANTNAANATYQWSNAAGNISGATGISYTATVSGAYKVTVTDGVTGCVNTSAPVTVTINPLPSPVVLSPTSAAICEGSSTVLNASSLISESATIGTGTVSNVVTTPYKGNWGGTRVQMLYTKAELNAMGIQGGSSINSVGFKITSYTGPYTFNNFTIKMKHTSASTLTSTFETAATTVFGPTNYVLAAGTVPFNTNHTLNTPFVWNGTSNLIVEFCFSNNNSGGGSVKNADVASTTKSGSTVYSSTDNITTNCSSSSGTTSGTRPNITLGYQSNVPITWSPATGLSATTGNSVTANPTETTTYTATATNSYGCTTQSNVTVTVSPALQVGAAISGPDNACAYMGSGGQLAVYSVSASNASNYVWTIPAGATDVTGQGTNTISFRYPMSFTSGNISVSVEPLAPCTEPIVRSIAVGRTIPPAPVVSGIVNVCNYVGTGVQLTYSVTPDPNVSSYTWSVGPQVTIVSGQGTSSINVLLAPGFINSPASKQIRVTGLAQCGQSDLAIFYITAQLPQTPGSISGPTELCSYIGSGSQATYSIDPVTSATSYNWNVPAGATIVGAANGTSINVTFNNTFTGGYVSVASVNSCGSATARSLPVKRTIPSTPGLISGPKNICLMLPSAAYPSGQVGVYSVTRSPNVTYVWTLPEGIVLQSQTSTATEDQITVNYTSEYAGGSISVKAVGECGVSQERVLILAQLAPGSVAGILELSPGSCEDRTYVYGVPSLPTNATSLQWTVPEGAVIISGQGTTTITVNYPGTSGYTGEITAIGDNGCGQSQKARIFPVKIGTCSEQPLVKGNIKVQPNVTLEQTLDVNVYPNPSVASFKLKAVSSNANEVMHVRIVDNLGREHKRLQMKAGETITFGAELKAGSYFVEVSQGKNKTVKKVIKF